MRNLTRRGSKNHKAQHDEDESSRRIRTQHGEAEKGKGDRGRPDFFFARHRIANAVPRFLSSRKLKGYSKATPQAASGTTLADRGLLAVGLRSLTSP
jgi:hypothetical protein